MSLCPDCAEKMHVEKTTTASTITVRVEQCPAGHRWETESVVTSTRRLPAAIRKARPVAGNRSNELRATGESPPPVAGNPPATGAGGVRGGLSPIRGSIRDLRIGNQPKGGDPERADAIPPAAVAAPDRPSNEPAKQEVTRREDPKHPRTAQGLLALFGRRWEAHERKLWLKQPFDDRNAVDLVEAIREIPDEDDRERAFEDVATAVETYLRIEKPFYAGHPFSTFVKELPALRTGDAAGLDRLRRTKPEWDAADRKHRTAAAGTRESEPTPLAALAPPAPWTPEQIAEAERLRKPKPATTGERP